MWSQGSGVVLDLFMNLTTVVIDTHTYTDDKVVQHLMKPPKVSRSRTGNSLNKVSGSYWCQFPGYEIILRFYQMLSWRKMAHYTRLFFYICMWIYKLSQETFQFKKKKKKKKETNPQAVTVFGLGLWPSICRPLTQTMFLNPGSTLKIM